MHEGVTFRRVGRNSRKLPTCCVLGHDPAGDLLDDPEEAGQKPVVRQELVHVDDHVLRREREVWADGLRCRFHVLMREQKPRKDEEHLLWDMTGGYREGISTP